MTDAGTDLATRPDAQPAVAGPDDDRIMLPGEVKPHPKPYQYVIIAAILCVITAVEVAVSYLEGHVSDGIVIALLLIMAGIKFFLVASWFMHLRTDKPIFRRMFVVGLIGAGIVFTIALLMLHVYQA